MFSPCCHLTFIDWWHADVLVRRRAAGSCGSAPHKDTAVDILMLAGIMDVRFPGRLLDAACSGWKPVLFKHIPLGGARVFRHGRFSQDENAGAACCPDRSSPPRACRWESVLRFCFGAEQRPCVELLLCSCTHGQVEAPRRLRPAPVTTG